MNALDFRRNQSVKPACFKAYDVRGKMGTELDTAVARRIGGAFARQLGTRLVVVGRDCRASSEELHSAVVEGLRSENTNVIDIGLAGTEEVYFATTYFAADGGIQITASHNPINYNGMKFVGKGSRPLTKVEFDHIAMMVGSNPVSNKTCQNSSHVKQVDIKIPYAKHVVKLINLNNIKSLKIVVNAGNGVAGPAFDAIIDELNRVDVGLDIVRVHHRPDGSFPNGIPNPLLKQNRPATSRIVREVGADLGVAWDADFDRCFFFDKLGNFIAGEYVVGLLSSAFLTCHPDEKIVHDPRVIWNTKHQIARHGGTAIVARTGHANIKQAMRDTGAIYGGEMSAHHYFRDFMCCDSGMIPWLKVIELMGLSGKSLADLVESMILRFPSSGEINFKVKDPDEVINHIQSELSHRAISIDKLDGLSMTFANWRVNIRRSSTEPLLRLNLETKGDTVLLQEKTKLLKALCSS